MRKASKDASMSRVYAKFGIEIYATAKKGGSHPEANAALKVVLERAKAMNVPRAIIDRALEKATDGADDTYEALRYEGFGAHGAMVIVDTLTNNVNRTVADVRAAFTKNGGNLGVSGAVSYSFDEVAIVGVSPKAVMHHGDASYAAAQWIELLWEWMFIAEVEPRDVFYEEATDADEDEDVQPTLIIYGAPADFHRIQDVFRQKGVQQFLAAEITWVPQHEVALPPDAQPRFEQLLEALDRLEDVQRVYHNVT